MSRGGEDGPRWLGRDIWLRPEPSLLSQSAWASGVAGVAEPHYSPKV